jgi:hypothetical protein
VVDPKLTIDIGGPYNLAEIVTAAALRQRPDATSEEVVVIASTYLAEALIALTLVCAEAGQARGTLELLGEMIAKAPTSWNQAWGPRPGVTS